MDSTAKPHRLLTPEEYLELEDTRAAKHEYVAGETYALAGASRRHNTIAGNIFARLKAAAGTCRVYMSDVKVRIGDIFYYPDVIVACGPEGEDGYVEPAPCLIVEVTSPSTAVIDRREKLAAYQRIPELQAYLIVEQERRWVTRYWRDDDGAWSRADLVGEGRVPVPRPSLALAVADIYEGVDVPA